MAELLCFTPDHLSRQRYPETEGRLQARLPEGMQTMSLGQSRTWKNMVFCAWKEPEAASMSLLVARDNLVFGRDLLDVPDPALSARHFRLIQDGERYELEDLGSANGTYINGCRVRGRQKLNPLDRIQCAGCSLLWMDSFFICGFRQHGPPPAPLADCRKPQSADAGSRHQLPAGFQKAEPEKLVLESWVLQEMPVRQNLFLSCGSSLLMSAGSLLSAAALQAAGRSSPESVNTSLIMSLAMAASFLIYGLISRHVTWKQAMKEIRGKEEAYRQYLTGLRDQIRQLRSSMEQQQEQLAVLWQRLDPVLYQSGLPVPAGWEETSGFLTLEVPQFSWRHRQQPLFREVQMVVKEALVPVRRLRFEDMEGTVTGNRASLFAMTVWSQDPEQVKWGADPAVEGEWPHLWHNRQRVRHALPGLKVYGTLIQDDPGLPCSLEKLQHLAFLPGPVRQKTLQTGQGPQYRVLIGHSETGNDVSLDLVTDGPHGLVAGTTGSGKSEAMATLLCQLMLVNDPEHFHFLILDFKGGAFAAPFASMPHCAGVLTDLDEEGMALLQRALEAELKHRERRMQAFQERHPLETPDFLTLSRLESEPMPLLLVVADEFAQIREQYPARLAFLQSLARVGRSLGICLLLSTQRPQGIVDAQILANTGYVLCFRVRDRYESQEVLQDDRAARLRGAGDGWFGQTRFQALYARRPLHAGGCLRNSHGTILREIQAETWMEQALQKAAAGRSPCSRLLPGRPGPFQDPGLAQVLNPEEARLWILDPPPGTLTRILAPEHSRQVLEALQGIYPGLILPTAGSAWFALHMDGIRTVALLDQDPGPWLLPDIRVFLIQTKPAASIVASRATLVFGAAASLCAFGSFRHDCPFPTGLLQEGNQPLWMQTALPAQPVAQLPDFAMALDWTAVFETPVLGISENRPVFWDGSPLCILGEQAEEMAERLHQWRPDWPVSCATQLQKQTGTVLYTGGWKSQAWKLGLPSVPETWLLCCRGIMTGLEPLIHAG